jgi:hypothetical protein
MGNLKGNSLRTGLVVVLVVAVLASTMVHAKDYTVGVKAGDWVKYGQVTVTWTGNGTEPSSITEAKKMDWVRIDVISVAGTTASLNLTVHYNNGTQTYQGSDIDVQSSGGSGGMFLVASNLTSGDPVSPQRSEYTINQTVTRMYAGANRNVNIIDLKSSSEGPTGDSTGESSIYWDQNTGILVEFYINQTNPTNPSGLIEESVKATETNLWSANALDLIQNNLIYIIAGIAVIIVIVAASIVLRRRKTPSSQQPLPSPPSTPSPPPS